MSLIGYSNVEFYLHDSRSISTISLASCEYCGVKAGAYIVKFPGTLPFVRLDAVTSHTQPDEILCNMIQLTICVDKSQAPVWS